MRNLLDMPEDTFLAYIKAMTREQKLELAYNLAYKANTLLKYMVSTVKEKSVENS